MGTTFFFLNTLHRWKSVIERFGVGIFYVFNRSFLCSPKQSWPNGWRVRLVTWRLRVRVSGPAGIVGGGSECTALSLPSKQWLRWDPWARHRTPNCSPGAHCSVCVFTVCVCVCSLLTAVCVHLDGLNAEHKFQVWDATRHVLSFPKAVFIWSKYSKTVILLEFRITVFYFYKH